MHGAAKREIYSRVIAGDAQGVSTLISQALEQGLSPEELLNEALIAAMAKVGDRFEKREFCWARKVSGPWVPWSSGLWQGTCMT